jgi:dolichol-phosphate mannosyltransferase
MKNYIIIPTYKEADNLRELLPIIKKYNVIVVDDSSLDGTEDVCKKYKNVKLLTRKGERGLASAVVSGIKGVDEKDAKIVVMDADMQHDPDKLPEFFRKLESYDFVYGSREKLTMPFYRRVISKTAKTIARTLISKADKIDDPMSGFFGFKLSSVDMQKVKPIGYKIMLEIAVNLKNGAKITKVNYKFGSREFGKSKLGFKTMLDFILQVLRLNDYRILLFGLVGLSGIAVNETAAFLLHPYLPLYAVFALSAEISILTNFLLNHNFTFKRRARLSKSLPRYNLVALFGLFINVVFAVYLSLFMEYLLANLIGILIAFIFNYILSEKFAWRVHD